MAIAIVQWSGKPNQSATWKRPATFLVITDSKMEVMGLWKSILRTTAGTRVPATFGGRGFFRLLGSGGRLKGHPQFACVS